MEEVSRRGARTLRGGSAHELPGRTCDAGSAGGHREYVRTRDGGGYRSVVLRLRKGGIRVTTCRRAVAVAGTESDPPLEVWDEADRLAAA
jgi:hypothetical protein